MDYIVLSPVGNRKGYILKDFLAHVKNFNPPPKEIVLCLALDHKFNPEDFEGCTIRYNSQIFAYDGDLERICESREVLRKYFIYHPANYECALWVDTDILCPPETPLVLSQKMRQHNCLIVVNKVQGRMSNRKLCGSGVMLTHRHACTASKFWVGNIFDQNGVEKHLSEDFVFFAIFDQGKSLFKLWTGKQGRVCDEYVEVNHVVETSKK